MQRYRPAAVEIRPFTGDDVEPAARLLAERHAREREAEPLLPASVDYAAQVEGEWRREGATGAVALREGTFVGYLVGAPAPADNRGGTRILVDLAGHAVEVAETARDLYAAAAERWVADGVTAHAVVVPANDAALVDAWFRLAFGLQFVCAVREASPGPPVDARVAVRPGRPDDLEHVARFDRILWEHQVRSPSFSGNRIESDEEFRAEWADLWDDAETYTHLVAERDGTVVGHAVLYRRPEGDVRVPPGNVDLAHAATDLEVRGSGVGLALTAALLAWAYEQGFRSVTTDWRSVNLLSSRFWPRRGWRPTHLRLYRAIP